MSESLIFHTYEREGKYTINVQYTRYVRKVMRLIFLGQAEGLGSGVSGPDSWWGMSGKRSDPAHLPLSLYRMQIASEVDSCLSIVS
jgi:hypothetical protein